MVDRQRGQPMTPMTFRIFSRIPFSVSVLSRLTRTKLLIPYYHVVSDEPVAHIKHLYKYKTIREFTDDLDFLLRNYSPIGLREVLSSIKTDRPPAERVFLLTFDDGYREMSHTVAPILLKKGIPATFFVNSAFIDNRELCYLNKASLIVARFRQISSSRLARELATIFHADDAGFDAIESQIVSVEYQRRDLLDQIADIMNLDFNDYLSESEPYLTANQITDLIQNGFTIGAHSVDHPLYSSLTLEDQLYQTVESVRCVREMFHLDYGVFAFPFSDHGISRKFFARLSHSGLVDASFGTAGLIDDSVPNHLQRFSLEKPIDTAERIVTFQHARKLRRLITRMPVVVRT